MESTESLLAVQKVNLEEHLKKWFGYNSFRLYQKEIVEAILQKKDVVAILPTGAGKSLCYQLPALLVEGTAIVVSPLISLMQDQVSQLIKSGIPAAYINSSLPWSELADIMRNVKSYKLVYIAPERFADSNFLQLLLATPLSFFVIDEAHCISQWGHSFRPDYRGLSLIKKNFPTTPMMAFTATATPEVEEDIISQLVMKAPFVAKASFDRPNLTIRITSKLQPSQQIKAFLEKHQGESGIIYAATRKTVDSLYELLQNKELENLGFQLGKYHAGMADHERTESLHNFIHDKITLMVATVAFGMGINKPDVRFVIHHDMPKTIEQYYQEIGRAGRDGLPAECLMLYSGQDLMIYKLFSKDLTDPILRSQMESKTESMYALCRDLKCRRASLLNYFGEKNSLQNCAGCDNCIDDVETMEATVISQKILSCVYRLHEGFGVRYMMDVLRGSKSAKVISRGHERLSTYGLLSGSSEAEVHHYIDSLLSLGLLKISQGQYPVLQLTETSHNVLKGEKKVEFRKKIFKTKIPPPTQLPYNISLFGTLRELRLELAREKELPPFVIFSDKSLFEMATYFPISDSDFLSINGVGRHKLEQYGEKFLSAIREFCSLHKIIPAPKVQQVHIAREVPSQPLKTASAEQSLQLFLQGNSIDEIAKMRGSTTGTVTSHLCKYIESGTLDVTGMIDSLVSKERQEAIHKAIDEVGIEKLAPIKQQLPNEISYDEIRFVVAVRRAQLCQTPNILQIAKS